jgi:single-strand DNA-binding protein
MSYHKIIIVGYCGSDPTMRFTPNGVAVTNMNVASNRTWTDTDGTKKSEVTWWRVSVFGKQAEACNNYLQKGSLVLVDGELRPDKETGNPRVFTRNDGTTGASYEVFAHNVRFLSSNEAQETAPMNDEQIPF